MSHQLMLREALLKAIREERVRLADRVQPKRRARLDEIKADYRHYLAECGEEVPDDG